MGGMARSDRLRSKAASLTRQPPSSARDAAFEAADLQYIACAHWEQGCVGRFFRLPVLRHSIAVCEWAGERARVTIPFVFAGLAAEVLFVVQPWKG